MKKVINNSEKSYQAYLAPTKLESFRLFCILGSLLFLVFIFADMYSLTIAVSDALMIRGFTALILLGALYLSYKNNFMKYYELIVTSIFLLCSFTVLVMVYLAQIDDKATSVYFAGVMLVIMALLSWSYLSMTSIALVLASLVTGYVVAIVLSKNVPWSEVIVSILFIGATIVIGVASQILRSRYLKEIFMLKEALRESLKEKTVESKANAFIANHDVLTGLPNRRIATTRLEKSLNIAKQKDKILLIIFIDLNSLKQINDMHGYAIGDKLVKTVAKRLGLVTRGDCLSRLGGAEFLVGLLLEKSELSSLDSMLTRYENIINKSIKIENKTFKLDASIGMSAYPRDDSSISGLMEMANDKMHEAKHRNELRGNSTDSLDSLLVALKA